MSPAESPPPQTHAPTLPELFWGYVKIGLLGFGGVGPIARHVIVVERKWLTEREYAEILGLGQVLPGPNVGNSSIMIGRRFGGMAGVLSVTAGFYSGPLCILLCLALFYDRFGQEPGVERFMHGIAAAAAGMVLGTAMKMAGKLKPPPEILVVGLLTVFAAFVLRMPLYFVVLLAGALGIGAATWRATRMTGAR